jgi:hypothetical protein
MFRRGNKNCIEGEISAGPATERKGEVNTLGHIYLDTPSPRRLHFMEMIFESIGGCGGINIRLKDTLVVRESC